MRKNRHRGGNPISLIRTNAGNLVKSRSEAQIDNWLHKRGFDFEYEPKLWLEGEGLSPDWIVSGLKGRKFDRPLIIEYWGLLRPGKAKWLPKRIPKYLELPSPKLLTPSPKAAPKAEFVFCEYRSQCLHTDHITHVGICKHAMPS